VLLTEELLGGVIDSHKADLSQACSLLLYGTVKEDFLNFFNTPPYGKIFFDKKEMNDVLNVLETVHLPISILQTLDYFKKFDFHTYSHVLMVFALSTLLAKDLIPDFKDYVQLSATGPTHDIGKICVPLHILKKTTPLTKTERRFIEHHATAGYVLLNYYSKGLQHLACKVALEHHERRDGSGYPQNVLLEDPLVEIIAVSDVYDALIKPRPYRSGPYDNRTALEEITQMAIQGKLGWDAVKALIAHNRSSKPHFREITISDEKRGTPPLYNVYGITTAGEKTDREGQS
jgi:HD-GYP domain-containing protein (c-di-GMP phosphodiesterase class II)